MTNPTAQPAAADVVRRLAPSLFTEHGNWRMLSTSEKEELTAVAQLANLYRVLLTERRGCSCGHSCVEGEQ